MRRLVSVDIWAIEFINEDCAVKNRKVYVTRVLVLVSFSMFCGALTRTHGQQTIFNVPSTDVLDKGKVYGELDASLKPTDGAAVPKFSSFVPRVVVGAGQSDRVRIERYRQHSTRSRLDHAGADDQMEAISRRK